MIYRSFFAIQILILQKSISVSKKIENVLNCRQKDSALLMIVMWPLKCIPMSKPLGWERGLVSSLFKNREGQPLTDGGGEAL